MALIQAVPLTYSWERIKMQRLGELQTKGGGEGEAGEAYILHSYWRGLLDFPCLLDPGLQFTVSLSRHTHITPLHELQPVGTKTLRFLNLCSLIETFIVIFSGAFPVPSRLRFFLSYPEGFGDRRSCDLPQWEIRPHLSVRKGPWRLRNGMKTGKSPSINSVFLKSQDSLTARFVF